MSQAAHEQVEIEIKFDAAAEFVLPDLQDVLGVSAVGPAVDHELAATYLDTAGLHLAMAGITLRRRTGGTDAGWHLKQPKVDDARVEVHHPLGRSVRTPPSALTKLVRVHLRDRPLAAVATLVTHRSVTPLLGEDGQVLAEVADDHVEGRRSGEQPVTWREIEVELVGGDRSLLAAVGARLTDAGAVAATSSSKLARVLGPALPAGSPHASDDLDASSPAGDVLRRHLAEQIAALERWDPLARVDVPDAVHKMRVAVRRLRSALVTFRPLVDRSVTDPLREELKWLGGVLGGPRDEEVMHARLLDLLAGEDRMLVLGPVRRRIDVELRSRHRARHRELVAELGGPRYFRLLDALDELAADLPLLAPADQPASKALPPLVARTRKRVLRCAAEVAAATEDRQRGDALHEVRKAAKRARYAGEAVEPAFGAAATKFAAAMEHVQEVLGEHQDSLLTREMLRELGVQAHLAGENGFTFGRLHGLEVSRAERAEAAFGDALAAIAGKGPKWLR